MTSQHTGQEKKYEAVMDYFLAGGYGPCVARALMTCIERYLYTTDALGLCPGKWDADNMWHLCQLLKCVLKDEYGVDLEG